MYHIISMKGYGIKVYYIFVAIETFQCFYCKFIAIFFYITYLIYFNFILGYFEGEVNILVIKIK